MTTLLRRPTLPAISRFLSPWATGYIMRSCWSLGFRSGACTVIRRASSPARTCTFSGSFSSAISLNNWRMRCSCAGLGFKGIGILSGISQNCGQAVKRSRARQHCSTATSRGSHHDSGHDPRLELVSSCFRPLRYYFLPGILVMESAQSGTGDYLGFLL